MGERLVLSCIVFALACTPDDSDSWSILSAGTMSQQEAGDEATDEAETGDEGPNLGICAQYIDCVEAATPQMLTATKALYSSEGSCWSLAGVSESDCHIECRAMLRAIAQAFPKVEECFECVDDEGCTSKTPYCHVDGLCWDEPQVLSCDLWEPRGACREFGEGFTQEEKRRWCAFLDESLLPDSWMSEQPTPCSTNGAVGHCDWYTEGDSFVGLAAGPMSTYYYDNHPDFSSTAKEAEEWCINQLGGTWVPL